ALAVAVLGREFAILFAQQPRRLRRKRRWRAADDGAIGKRDRRPHRESVVFGQVLLQVRIEIVGGGAKHIAEVGVGIGDENRKVVLAVDMDVDRLIVGDDFGKQRNHEQDEKN